MAAHDAHEAKIEALFGAIGRFFVEYSHLHSTLEVVLVHLSGAEEQRRAWALISGSTTQPLADALFTLLAEVASPEWSDTDRAVTSRARKELNVLIENRNRVAHDLWILGGSTQPSEEGDKLVRTRYGRSPSRGLFIEANPTTIEELLELRETTRRLRSVVRSVAISGLVGETRKPSDLIAVVDGVLVSLVA